NIYELTVGRASATSDGIGGPNGDVYIDMPTSGSLGAGSLNTVKHVVVGQRKYVVGDVAPFRWFNAGDFGNTNLFNDDVMQAFQSAVYGVNMPIGGTDFFDAMDACCGDSTAVPGTDYVVRCANTYRCAAVIQIFDGDDDMIYYIVFGDDE